MNGLRIRRLVDNSSSDFRLGVFCSQVAEEGAEVVEEPLAVVAELVTVEMVVLAVLLSVELSVLLAVMLTMEDAEDASVEEAVAVAVAVAEPVEEPVVLAPEAVTVAPVPR